MSFFLQSINLTTISGKLFSTRKLFSGVYDFGKNDDDMSDFLHIEEFLKTAQEEDLLAIVRPGPYICSEYEFGGFPAWLLRDQGLTVRTSEGQYFNYVKRYFKVLLPILAALQFINGGPIVMFQVENEYANSGLHDLKYIRQLKTIMTDLGIFCFKVKICLLGI